MKWWENSEKTLNVQDRIDMQGGIFSQKSIIVQTEIRPCRGDFFLKINKLALKKALILHFNDSMMVSEFSLSFLPSIAILPKSN